VAMAVGSDFEQPVMRCVLHCCWLLGRGTKQINPLARPPPRQAPSHACAHKLVVC
jgi:hypothetical protein